jgi:hypothetical protein
VGGFRTKKEKATGAPAPWVISDSLILYSF